jgi:hypothetical protein
MYIRRLRMLDFTGHNIREKGAFKDSSADLQRDVLPLWLNTTLQS